MFLELLNKQRRAYQQDRMDKKRVVNETIHKIERLLRHIGIVTRVSNGCTLVNDELDWSFKIRIGSISFNQFGHACNICEDECGTDFSIDVTRPQSQRKKHETEVTHIYSRKHNGVFGLFDKSWLSRLEKDVCSWIVEANMCGCDVVVA